MAKILVVDDEPHIRRLASFILQRAGHAVITASSGEEALDVFPSLQPDLIIADISMPGIDGFELVWRLRGAAGGGEVPVIILTARGQARDEAQARSVGANGYVTKPFGSSQLVAEVDRLLAEAGGAGLR